LVQLQPQKFDALADDRNSRAVSEPFNVEKPQLDHQKSPLNVSWFDFQDPCEILSLGESTPMQRFNHSDRLAALPVQRLGSEQAWSIHPR
jgi:hypothetical protein